MILDHLDNAERYFPMHAGFRAAFDFLRKTDFSGLSAGRHEVDGERLFLVMNRTQGRGREASKLEAHRRYIDIQYTLTGPEEIGWRPTPTCVEVDTPFHEENDYAFYTDPSEAWFTVDAGRFAIFYPEDAHAPLAAPPGRALVKAVMKVAVDWR
jgi:YhcH/YjgK/YiaL family protein